MSVDKIRVEGDARVQYKTATVNGRNYGYLLSQPESGKYRATIFLLHGFPDLSMGWRYQIPFFLSQGLRVIAPDCLGYGRTDAPDDHVEYSLKRGANDIKELAAQLGESKIILGGHDWGAAFAYRVALWHPELVSHLFTVCVPYTPPKEGYIPLETVVRTAAPNFTYQVQFASGELEKVIKSKDEIKQFLLSLYGGRTPEGQFGFDVQKGALVDRLPRLSRSRLLSEAELDYYATEFSRNGVHGPLSWYRTRKVNHDDELDILGRGIDIPVLFIQALRDAALPPHLGRSMKKNIPNLAIEQVDTAHWALWEKPEEVNDILKNWLKGEVFKGTSNVKL